MHVLMLKILFCVCVGFHLDLDHVVRCFALFNVATATEAGADNRLQSITRGRAYGDGPRGEKVI
jgi:hypothetical protein